MEPRQEENLIRKFTVRQPKLLDDKVDRSDVVKFQTKTNVAYQGY